MQLEREAFDELERVRRDSDRRALARLIEAYRPLVVSVCRRYLRDPDDLEDAVQTTFLKFAEHAPRVESSLVAWLTAAAHSSSVDLIRSSARERGRRMTWARCQAWRAEHELVHELIRRRLSDALLELEEPSRQLIIERFFQKVPLREIAARDNVSAGTVSRRVAAAVRDLAEVLREMGVGAADDTTVAEHFGDARNLAANDDRLRLAVDWRCGEENGGEYLPGWDRPVRVGVLVSYETIVKPSSTGVFVSVQAQVRSTGLLTHPGFRFVGIVEPGTSKRGAVEQVIRDYQLFGGLIDATDEAGLKTLDLIMIGVNTFLSRSATRAISAAVRSGVGLLNEYWTGEMNLNDGDPHLAELMLADSRIAAVHTKPTCGGVLPATTVNEDQLLPGLGRGDGLMTYGCGPLYRPVEGAKVLIEKDRVVEEREHGIGGLGAARMPVCLKGKLGKGRVFIANVLNEMEIAKHLSVEAPAYMTGVAAWLVGGELDLSSS